jgi:hypothetical protein
MEVNCCQECPPPSLLRPFDASSFMERIYCGNWPDWLVTAWNIPSIGLFIVYLAIGVLTLRFWLDHRHGSNGYPVGYLPWIAAFFFGCGGGHLMNYLAFTWPAYVAFMMWDWYTLVTSVVGLYGFYTVLRWAQEKIRMLESGLYHAIDEKQIEAARADREVEYRAQAEERLREKFLMEFRKNEKKKVELDAIRDELTNLLNQQFTEEAYKSLRQRLHNLRNL